MRKQCSIGLLIICLIFGASPGLAAPNKVWMTTGTIFRFADSAQAPTAVLALTGIAAGAGQVSARFDKVAQITTGPSGALPYLWRWACSIQLSGAGVLDEVIEVYLSKSDGTISQGGFGASNGAVSSAQTKNLTFLGILKVDATASNPQLGASDYTEIRERYFSLVVFNRTSLPLVASTAAHACYMTPYTLEIQAYAPLDYDRHPEPAALPEPMAA